MIIMQLNEICKSFGAEQILSYIKLDIKHSDRIAIVGRNGTGKSTLLKIMAGKISYDSGEIFKPREVTTGYLDQHTALESDLNIWDEMVEVFNHLIVQEQELRKLEKKMEQSSSSASVFYENLLKTYDEKQQAFIDAGGYTYEANIKSILTGLDFLEADFYTPIHELSGGQKTRLALGKLLLQQPDLLILDEPTNHLDIETMSWLESYLNNYTGAVVIVSHDRYFLEKTVSIIYEIAHKQAKRYVGTYEKYLKQKEKDYEKELSEYEQQQAHIKKEEDFIQRNIARASTSRRAQSRRRQLENMKVIDKPLGEKASASFSFQVKKRSGNDVLIGKELAFYYENQTDLLFKNLNLHIHRGDRIAIVGPNGVGKTTLLTMLLGNLKPTRGTIDYGTNVQIGYYDQEQANLTSSNTVLDELWNDFRTVNERDVRTLLGNFLFSGDDVLQPVHSLSGGEKARLALAKLMMQKANLLILDEPTNHLDIDSKEVLESALNNYPGTIIFVSHDRYFINKIADQVLEMQQDGVTTYLGNYDYYVEKKQEQKEIAELEGIIEEKQVEENEGKRNFREERRLQSEQRTIKRKIKKTEEKIANLEEELELTELKMTEPEVFQDHEKSLELSNDANKLKEKIEKLMEEWADLH